MQRMSNGWDLSFCVQMANNLEGGKSPQLRPEVLHDLGFKLVAYPLSLLGVSVRAMQVALQGLAQGKPPPPSAMPSFQVIFVEIRHGVWSCFQPEFHSVPCWRRSSLLVYPGEYIKMYLIIP